MSARTGYGTQPDAIAGLLAAAGGAVVVLSYEEDRTFAALSLSRFGAVTSSRLNWAGAEVLQSSPVFDGDELRKLLRGYARPEELAVVFWGNLAVPSLALEAGLAAAHADAVLECCYECWIYLVDTRVLIEFQDGEGFIVGRVPS
ncbi:hypothetical protein ABZX38_32835 [Streptomyces longwoodensis]|uniref:hypothetical protein n=1 Tax=Streptomyces longwoodensis TaxID=68231 RepID=UPI0033BE189F